MLFYHFVVWQPSLDKVLLLQAEPTNIKDNKVVALVVGHKLSVLFCQFVSRTFNKGTVEVTGAVVNRGAEYGIACMVLEPMWSVCRK